MCTEVKQSFISYLLCYPSLPYVYLYLHLYIHPLIYTHLSIIALTDVL